MIVQMQESEGGLEVEIHKEVSLLLLACSGSVFFLLLLVGVGPALKGLQMALHSGKSTGPYLAGSFISSILSLLVLFSMIRHFFSSLRMRLNATDLLVQERLYGLTIEKHAFNNEAIAGLRFEESWNGVKGTPIQSALCIECDEQTLRVAEQISRDDGLALLEAMRKVYNFPEAAPPA